MKSTPLVTIAIPTYNRANGYLRQALQSALYQTYQDLEIFISDNCSADETSALVAGVKDPRIRYFRHPKNIGANNNFNFCIQEAKGKYLLLLHDDDMIDPDFVETCVKAAEGAGEAGLIRTGTRIIDGDGKVLREAVNLVAGLSLSDFFLAWFSGKTALYLCSTLFDAAKLRAGGGLQSKHNLFQDVMAEVKLAARYGRVDVSDIKATFRIHSAEMSFASGLRPWCEDSLLLLDLMCDLAPQSQTEIRRRGMRFFAGGNYYRASAVKSRWRRLGAYLTVWRMYGYRQLPSFRMLVSQTFAYRTLRQLKGMLKPA